MANNKTRALLTSIMLTAALGTALSGCHSRLPKIDANGDVSPNYIPPTDVVSEQTMPDSAPYHNAPKAIRTPHSLLYTLLPNRFSRRKRLLNELKDRNVKFFFIGDNLYVELPSDTIFLVNSSQLNEDHFYILDLVVKLIETYPYSKVEISAHTDNVGSKKHNFELSTHQAQAIMAYLWAHGIDYHKMHEVGYAWYRDVASNRTVLGSHMNRRVEIHLKDQVIDFSKHIEVENS